MKGSRCRIIPISGKTLFEISNTSTTKESNVHTLLKQQTGEWLLVQSFDPSLKTQEGHDLQTSHSNDCSVKKYSEDPAEGLNLIEVFRVKIKWEGKGLLLLKIYQGVVKTFCASTYKDSAFTCAVVGVQPLTMVKIYNMPLFITFRWSRGLDTEHTTENIKFTRIRSPKTPKTILLWLEIAYVVARRRPGWAIWFSFTSQMFRCSHPESLSKAKIPELSSGKPGYYIFFVNVSNCLLMRKSKPY